MAPRGTNTAAFCVSVIKNATIFHDAYFRGGVAQKFYPQFDSSESIVSR